MMMSATNVNESTPILQGGSEVVEISRKGKSIWLSVMVSLIVCAVVILGSIGILPDALNDGTQSAAFRSFVSNSTVLPKFYMNSRKNGYEPISTSILEMYNYEMVLEPFVENVLSVSSTTSNQFESVWSIKYDETIPGSSANFIDDKSEGEEVYVRLQPANLRFEITVTVYPPDGGSFDIVRTGISKFVRREIRSLSTPDRERYFNAVEKIFTLTMEEGQTLYGQRFSSHDAFTALHDSMSYLYHDNLFFLTSHPTMQLRYEKSLIAIDKEVPLPYWDFLKDAVLGSNWTSSPI